MIDADRDGASRDIRDVFISHASEDKDLVARPLAEALVARGLSVWYDEYDLAVGDRLSTTIDRGLANSRFGVVIISPAFLRKVWPQRELSGLVARETSNGESIILPVWHNVTQSQILEFSPPLADIVAIRTAGGFDAIVTALLPAVMRRRAASERADHPPTDEYAAGPSGPAALPPRLPPVLRAGLVIGAVVVAAVGLALLLTLGRSTNQIPCDLHPTASTDTPRFDCAFVQSGNGKTGGSPVLRSSGALVGYLHQGTNWVECQQPGREMRLGQRHNHNWAWTQSDYGSDQRGYGWVNGIYARGGDNDGRFANVPDCADLHGDPPRASSGAGP